MYYNELTLCVIIYRLYSSFMDDDDDIFVCW
jgi:hypothetical protein